MTKLDIPLFRLNLYSFTTVSVTSKNDRIHVKTCLIPSLDEEVVEQDSLTLSVTLDGDSLPISKELQSEDGLFTKRLIISQIRRCLRQYFLDLSERSVKTAYSASAHLVVDSVLLTPCETGLAVNVSTLPVVRKSTYNDPDF